jgi:hypothetical protein
MTSGIRAGLRRVGLGGRGGEALEYNEFVKRKDVFFETIARIRIVERFTDIAN